MKLLNPIDFRVLDYRPFDCVFSSVDKYPYNIVSAQYKFCKLMNEQIHELRNSVKNQHL